MSSRSRASRIAVPRPPVQAVAVTAGAIGVAGRQVPVAALARVRGAPLNPVVLGDPGGTMKLAGAVTTWSYVLPSESVNRSVSSVTDGIHPSWLPLKVFPPEVNAP